MGIICSVKLIIFKINTSSNFFLNLHNVYGPVTFSLFMTCFLMLVPFYLFSRQPFIYFLNQIIAFGSAFWCEILIYAFGSPFVFSETFYIFTFINHQIKLGFLQKK